MSFWSNKPIHVSNTHTSEHLLQEKELMKNIDKELGASKVQLRYDALNLSNKEHISTVVQFINKNYGWKSSKYVLQYYEEVVQFFGSDRHIALMFYPTGGDAPVGLIVGSVRDVMIKTGFDSFEEKKCVEVNFLCVVQQLRKTNISPFLINTLAKNCLQRFNVTGAFYTVARQLHTEHFGVKRYYHRPLSIERLVEVGLIGDIFLRKSTMAVYKSFNVLYDMKKATEVVHFSNEQFIDNQLVDEVHDRLELYSKANFAVYTKMSRVDVYRMFTTPNIHCFVIKEGNVITDFVCMITVDTLNISNGIRCKAGHVYSYFFNDDSAKVQVSVLEAIGLYAAEHSIFDMITVLDIIGVTEKEYYEYKFLRGSAQLYYYMYNISMQRLDAKRIGMNTI